MSARIIRLHPTLYDLTESAFLSVTNICPSVAEQTAHHKLAVVRYHHWLLRLPTVHHLFLVADYQFWQQSEYRSIQQRPGAFLEAESAPQAATCQVVANQMPGRSE